MSMTVGEKVSGLDVDISFDDMDITVEKITLDIEDNSKASKSRGVSSGRLRGSISAKGSVELNSYNFNRLIEKAQKAGSFRQLPSVDVMFYAKTVDVELKVEAFGCYFNLTNLLDVDQVEGGDGLVHKLDFEVCGRDFVKINGVPVLSADEVKHLARR